MLYLLLHQRMDLRLNGYNGVAEDCCSAAENFRPCGADSADYLPGTNACTSGEGWNSCRAIGPPGWFAPAALASKDLRSVPC